MRDADTWDTKVNSSVNYKFNSVMDQVYTKIAAYMKCQKYNQPKKKEGFDTHYLAPRLNLLPTQPREKYYQGK